MARLLVVGCGYVGASLAERAIGDGDTVFGLRRSEAPLPAGVEAIRADVSSPLAPGSLPEDLDAVVYAVAAKSRDEAVYRAAYVDGLRHVLEALRQAPKPPRRLVFTSSTAVYGQAAGEWIDETSETSPRSFSGRILLEAEALLADAPCEGVALRLGGIYGPGRTSRLRAVAEGRITVRDGAPHYTNRIHRDDAAGAIQCLLAAPSAPAIVLGVDDEPVDEATLADWMAELVGAPAPRRVAPDEATPPRAGSKRCRNDLLRSLGYDFAYPTYREGYASLLGEVVGDAPS
ncbi:MAG: SDR family oxidoreductase [Actinomycetota bacterium]|nr:SDR family oxidoreductase [Actinomycetota bacterium]